jgi:hypothetical protein
MEKRNSSVIVISKIYDLGEDKKAKFGQIIRIRLEIYKGNTNKETIKAWIIKDSKKLSKQTQINLINKFTNYSITLPIQIFPNCKQNIKKGYYNINVEGLDRKTKKEIYIEGITQSLCEKIEVKENTEQKKISYEVFEMPLVIENKKEFSVILSVKNPNNQDKNIEASCYVYRGSKHYSKEEKVLFMIKANSSKKIFLRNIVKDAEEGNYKFKIKLKKQEMKTSYDKTIDIKIIKRQKQENSTNQIELLNKKENNKTSLKSIPNNIIARNPILYESESSSLKKYFPYILIILFSLAVIFSIMNSKKHQK